MRAGAGGELTTLPLPDNPWPESREITGRIASRQHIKRGVKDIPWQRFPRRCATNGGIPVIHVQRIHGNGGDSLLGQHIKGISRRGQGLKFTRQHTVDHDRGINQLTPGARIEKGFRCTAHLMSGAADTLQAAGNRKGGGNLNHQIHCPHINPQFKA